MKASHQWLRALVPQLPDDPAALAARFTAAGLEVEGMHAYGAGTEACVVAKVVSVRPHPTKSGLRLVTVDRGEGGDATQEVVCGAPNVPAPGGLVVLAPLGTHLPAKGMTIERRAIGGVVSEGMLCSEQELGLTEESDGIIVLPADLAAPGTPLLVAEPSMRDTIFEIGLSPNRPDCLGHRGLAREAAALFAVPWSPPEPASPTRAIPRGQGDRAAELSAIGSGHEPIEKLVTVRIEDGERCPHYAASAVVDATIGPSPLWLRYRLASLGVRPISNAVDITNLVMLEYGHPLHAFDLDKVRGAAIVVRRANEGEKLVTLDGVDRTLTADDLVICDAGGPVALGGVMGGGDSEISASTRRVLLECAYFEPRGVRRTARRHALHTEASHRFERGVDHGDTLDALAQAAALMSRLAGAAVVPGMLNVVAREIPKATVTLRHARLEQLLGVSVPHDEARMSLERLGLEPHLVHGGEFAYEIPTHRPDLLREVDLIDEVARVRGFDKIPAVLPAIRPSRDAGDAETLTRRTRSAAVAMGLSEALTYAFVAPDALAKVGAPVATVVLRNPLSEHQTVMRTSLLPGLFEALARARRHGERDVALFTIGSVFLDAGAGAKALPEERLAFAAVLAGQRRGYLSKESSADVWDGKGLALGLVERLTRRHAIASRAAEAERPKTLHPRGAALLDVNGRRVGSFGVLHPDVVDAFDLGGDAIVVELDLAALDGVGRVTPSYVAIPRFPASTRDVALVVHDDVAAGDVLGAVREVAGALAEDVRLFDRFVGAGIPADHASLAFHVVYRAPDRTLTDAEVDAQHAKVVAEVGKRFGATLRA